MTAKSASTPQAAFPSVRKSARWKPRIIERCLGALMGMRLKCYHRAPLSTARDPRELIEAYYHAGWTGGLPLVPPSDASIEEMLAAGGWRGDTLARTGVASSLHPIEPLRPGVCGGSRGTSRDEDTPPGSPVTRRSVVPVD